MLDCHDLQKTGKETIDHKTHELYRNYHNILILFLIDIHISSSRTTWNVAPWQADFCVSQELQHYLQFPTCLHRPKCCNKALETKALETKALSCCAFSLIHQVDSCAFCASDPLQACFQPFLVLLLLSPCTVASLLRFLNCQNSCCICKLHRSSHSFLSFSLQVCRLTNLIIPSDDMAHSSGKSASTVAFKCCCM